MLVGLPQTPPGPLILVTFLTLTLMDIEEFAILFVGFPVF